MAHDLKTNVHINFLFYRRNKLLVIVGILCFALMVLTMIPSMIFTSANERFQLASRLYQFLVMFLYLLVALIALISVWYHRSNRCLKLIFTKPYAPEQWVFSHYVSVVLLISVGLFTGVFLYGVLSLCWGLPLQVGVLGAVVYHFCGILLVYSYLLALSSWVHPVVATVLYLLFSEGLFHWLALLCRAGAEAIEAGLGHVTLVVLDKIFYAIYFVLPTSAPFGEALSRVSNSFRMGWGDLKYVAGTLVYFAIMVSLAYLLTVLSLRRRSLT